MIGVTSCVFVFIQRTGTSPVRRPSDESSRAKCAVGMDRAARSPGLIGASAELRNYGAARTTNTRNVQFHDTTHADEPLNSDSIKRSVASRGENK